MNGWFTADRLWMFSAAIVIGWLGWVNGLHRPAIEGDGIDQVVIGWNLVHGRGPVGPAGGVELQFPPLYPVLVGLVSLVTPDLERAGRLVSAAAGALLAWPVFRLALAAGGPLAARAALLLLVGIPALAGVNSLVGGEGLYALCMAFAAWALWRAASTGRSAACAAAGGVFGLAYLTRIEALGYLAVLPPILAWMARRAGAAWGTALARAAACAAAFLLVASPYLWLVHRETGRWMGSPKFVKVLIGGEAIDPAIQARDGKFSYEAVAYGLSADGEKMGFEARPEDLRAGGIGYVARRLPVLMVRYANNLYSLYTRQAWFVVPPVLFTLAVLGIVALRGATCVSVAWLAFGAPFLTWLALPIGAVQPRFLLAQVPLFAALGGVGVVWLASRWHRPGAALALAGLLSVAHLPDVMLPTVAARWLSYKQAPGADSKAAGLWLRDHGGPGAVVMDRLPTAAFYAGARFVSLPFAAPDAILRYARRHGVTHLVLEESVIRDVRPELIPWLEGRAPTALEPVHEEPGPQGRVLVCRLRPERQTSRR